MQYQGARTMTDWLAPSQENMSKWIDMSIYLRTVAASVIEG